MAVTGSALGVCPVVTIANMQGAGAGEFPLSWLHFVNQ